MTTIRQESIRLRTARNALAVCVGLAFASSMTRIGAAAPMPPANTTWTVENCDDDGVGSLRQVLTMVADHDTVDLSALTCSTITLTSGQLVVGVDNLGLFGNGVTIAATASRRVLSHTGAGTLIAYGVNFIDGFASGAKGGCIYSQGSVDLNRVTVRGCAASGPRGIAGGGIFAAGDIDVAYSTIADNEAILAGGRYYDSAHGGGLAAYGNIDIASSTISGNSVISNSVYSDSGGFSSGGAVTITYSTISANHAYVGGAGSTHGWAESDIVDSTISGNTSILSGAGLVSFDSVLRIQSSTIAFNSSSRGFCGAGVLTLGFQNVLYIESSIIAKNTGASGAPQDICWQGSGGGGVLGQNDLIIASFGGEPSDTIHDDPLLAPLADNGGGTMTHALLPGSPAIDRGSNASQLATDQRGAPRISGSSADIGAFELQQPAPPDEIFRNGFDASG